MFGVKELDRKTAVEALAHVLLPHEVPAAKTPE